MITGIIILLIWVNIGSTFAGDADVKTMSPVCFDGNRLYVGGSGPGNYSTIQSAVNDAENGDTIYVYSGIYLEPPYLYVNKSINLIGEDKETTIIDGEGRSLIVIFKVDGITMQDFTIRNSDSGVFFCGIRVQTNYNKICDNIIVKHGNEGIEIDDGTHHNTICDNYFEDSGTGICLRYDSHDIDIYNNIISNSSYGILFNSGNHTIFKNLVKDSYIGMYFAHSSNNEVINNVLEGNNIGIYLDNDCTNDLVSENNVINNTEYGILIGDGGGHVIIKNLIKSNKYGFVVRFSSSNEILSNFFLNNTRNALFQRCKNRWDGNYWNEPRTYPKIIFGMIGFFGLIPWIEIDWHPSQEPYGIS